MRVCKNKKGVAIILVMSALLLITTLVSQFLMDSMMSHQMALNYKKRVQSYYLAQSALNLSKMLLYYNKKVDKMLKDKNISTSDLGYEALYKQIPIDSEVLRGLMGGAAASSLNDEEQTVPEDETNTESTADEEAAEAAEETTDQVLGLLDTKNAEEFLNFEGNFFAEISEEETKYSLNAVAQMSTTSTASSTGTQTPSAYDLQKKILLSILLKPEFKGYFKNQKQDAEQLVHALSDFVDSNSSINEFDGVERGSEDSLYTDIKYQIKNAPMLTLSEMRLVAGMTDELYAALEPYVTVYSSSTALNVCLAPEETFDALLVYFSQNSKCTTALDAEQDTDEIEKIREDALDKCPNTTDVAASVNEALGLQSTTTSTTGTTSSSTTTGATTTQPAATTTDASGCEIKFADLITSNNNIFRVKGHGDVDGVTTTITLVINTASEKPSTWTTLYYQVD